MVKYCDFLVVMSNQIHINKKLTSPSSNRCGVQSFGFSLMELLIVASIMVALSSLSIFKYREYTTNIQLSNIALNAALAIRESQTFGVMSVESDGSSFKHAYGVYFNESNPSSYIFYVDSTNDDFWYNGTSEIINRTHIESGFTLNDVCIGPPSSPDCTITELSVTFKRPQLSARILSQNGGSESSAAQVRFNAPDGRTSIVHVTATGQIYVE